MWQDGLALLIVAIAAVGLLRAYIPVTGVVRGWRFLRRGFGTPAPASAGATTSIRPANVGGACSGCGVGSCQLRRTHAPASGTFANNP